MAARVDKESKLTAQLCCMMEEASSPLMTYTARITHSLPRHIQEVIPANLENSYGRNGCCVGRLTLRALAISTNKVRITNNPEKIG